jgi:succinate-semialdehyde dehydrogenase/glutarate-semialdehyde dehydrogenase
MLLYQQSALTMKRISLELGGNAPFIVFDDADLDKAVNGLIAGKFRNSGQTCVSPNRILVHQKVYDHFAEKLATAVETRLKVGNGLEDDVNQGPLINQAALDKVEGHVSDALINGGEALVGGRRHELGLTFYEPTVLVNGLSSWKCFSEETFGPVAPLFKFASDEEAIELANSTKFGLAAYFFSENYKKIHLVSERIQSGMVGANTGVISTEIAPFGGVKHSGLGREGSMYGIEEYLNLKYTCISL